MHPHPFLDAGLQVRQSFGLGVRNDPRDSGRLPARHRSVNLGLECRIYPWGRQDVEDDRPDCRRRGIGPRNQLHDSLRDQLFGAQAMPRKGREHVGAVPCLLEPCVDPVPAEMHDPPEAGCVALGGPQEAGHPRDLDNWQETQGCRHGCELETCFGCFDVLVLVAICVEIAERFAEGDAVDDVDGEILDLDPEVEGSCEVCSR